jgi:glucose/arabinose dehydrogenase
MKTRSLLFYIVFPGLTLLSSAFFVKKMAVAEQRTQDAVDPAARHYALYCAGCHGRNLEKFQEKPWMKGGGLSPLVQSITYGIADVGMPAFEETFTLKEIQALAAYVVKNVPADNKKLKPYDVRRSIFASRDLRFVLDTVVTGLKIPWGMAFLPDGGMLITERAGTMHLFKDGELSGPLAGVPEVVARNQGGLLDICLHPAYAENGWIYFTYSAPAAKGDGNSTAIMRARLDGNRLKDQELIFEAMPKTTKVHHYGSKLVFDREGYLYFGVGDRGEHFVFPQKLDNHNGKIHRIKDDGSIPADNPFVHTPGAMPSIYSFGHRNPQGTAMHPETGAIWASEHGPKGGDELNLILPGRNYGWPEISYGINYNGTVLTAFTEKEGMEQPMHQWTPSIAPCGMTFVSGSRYPSWKGNLLLGSLSFQYLERVVLDGSKVVQTEKLLPDIGRVRNVVMAPDGYIYVAVEDPGRILRIMPLN